MPSSSHQGSAPSSTFEHIRRYWDANHDTYVVQLLPGDYYVTTNNECLTTVLGSCIAACIRDPLAKVGGMNHFMLPVGQASDTGHFGEDRVAASSASRYGNYAMELLLNTILKHGGRREHLEVKIFGGGRIMDQLSDVGQRNIAFIREYILTEGLHLVAEHVGEQYPRKIIYSPLSGRTYMKRLHALQRDTIAKRETQYLGQIRQPLQGDIELF